MSSDPFKRREPEQQKDAQAPLVHVYGNRVVCATDKRGYPTPRGRSPFDIVVDASEGFIPLWAAGTTLRWRFQESSLEMFEDPTSAKTALRTLLAEAMLAWGDAAPIKLAERKDAWDFEIALKVEDNCNLSGCVLASAFFPDAGQHQLNVYPKMLEQSRTEQVETLIHELGHTFGLRHFFAQISETKWASEVFGEHKSFSIMNYGESSKLTDADKDDLLRLYDGAWSGELTHINGTLIRLQKPFHLLGQSFGA